MRKPYIFFGAFASALLAIALIAFYPDHLNEQAVQVQNPVETFNNDGNPAKAEILRKQTAAAQYGSLPIIFEPNVGQTDERVKFLARGNGYGLFLTDTEAVLTLEKHGKNNQPERAVVKMRIDGANAAPKSSGLSETESKSNYFIGNQPEKWQTNVANFQKVKYESIYQGVDLVYYGSGQHLEYDFIVAPNADPKQVKLKFDGIENAQIEDKSGDLLLETGVGTLRQHAPIVYQEISGERREIASSYKVQNIGKDFTVSFDFADYDESKELIIDPILAYGSYLGGIAFDEGRAVAVDAQGSAYIVGTAASRDFPTTVGTVKPVMLPRTDAPNSYWYDAFVTKVNPSGTALVYSTYFGGRNGNETGSGAAVDANGNVLFSGTTMAADFPVVNAYQTTFGGTDDAFAAKLNATGSVIIYSTYLGGNNTDLGGKIALNQTTGDAIFAGTSSSPNFPTTAGAYKEKLCNSPQTCSGIFYSGSYVVKLAANGGAGYSTLFDAAISDVALDAANNAVIGGTSGAAPTTAGAFQTVSSGGIEGYIAKLNPTGNQLVFGTFLGGGTQSDRVNSLAIDSNGSIYAAGQTQNTGFPTTPNAFDRTYNGGEDGFVTKFNPNGSALVYSTFLGGTGRDQPFGIGLGTDNSAFVTGETTVGATFPLKNSLNGTNGTIFLTRFDADAANLIYSTLLGLGGGYDLAVDGANSAYITGHTTSVVVTPNSFQPMKGEATSTSSAKDAFILKLSPTDETAQTFNISGTVTDPTQSGNYQPIVVTVTGTVNRSQILPYGNGSGMIPYFFGSLPAGGNYTITVRKVGFTVDPESVAFNNLGANQFADFTIQPNRAPEGVITSPAHGTTFNAPATVNITATASDPDGDAIQKVDFVAYSSETGAINLGTDTTAPYQFSWTNVPIGTWALSAIPTDSKGLRGVSTQVVHVFVVDSAGLSVTITSPTEGQSFVQGSDIPLSASVSSSVTVLEFYDQTNTLIGRRTSAPWATTWRSLNAGNYTVTAKVYNSQGQSLTSAPVSFVIAPINHRISGRINDSISNNPVGGITLNLTSATNPSISRTTTTDSGGNYLFTDLAATPNDGVTITPVSAVYTFAPTARNIGYLGYIEWTNQNFIATRQTQISVTMTSPTSGQIFSAPATINLAANASSGAGSISKVEFYRIQGANNILLGTDTIAPFEFQLTDVGVGNYSYFARATDSTNAVAESESVSVVVNLPRVTLSGRITNQAGNGVAGVTVYIAGAVAWTENTDANGNYTFADYPGGSDYHITPQPANGITFTPVSRSFTNVTTNISNINFTASTPNQPPTLQIVSPTNGATYTMPQPIPLNVTTTDPDNNVANLRVIANNGNTSTTIVQTTNNFINTTWQPTVPGNYILTAIVRDAGGLQATQEISITVAPPAPVSISGRIVTRDSLGISGATVKLVSYPTGESVNGGTTTTDANGNYTIQNITTFASYRLTAEKLNYTFAPPQRIYFNVAANQTADFTGTLALQPSDFDGDARSDIAVWRPSTGVWHILRSNNNFYTGVQFGAASLGDIAVPGNYDGDQKIDLAVFRNGNWYILNSSNGQIRGVPFGTTTDKPMPGDYDGDGKTDLAVFRPSNGYWYILRSSDNGFTAIPWGFSTDVPLIGDFDGDGLTDVAVFRPSNGSWYIRQSSDGNLRALAFGADGDIPLVGDFDGDKKSDVTVFRPSNGYWYSILSSDDSFRAFQWGTAGDVPTAGDYDLDGKTDYAVFRKSEGKWYIFKSSTNTYFAQPFGTPGDVPIPAASIR